MMMTPLVEEERALLLGAFWLQLNEWLSPHDE
jgi:hypothetical protein